MRSQSSPSSIRISSVCSANPGAGPVCGALTSNWTGLATRSSSPARTRYSFARICASSTQGKIRYIGFSFHDSPKVFEEIINAYDWDFCQIQLNYIDWVGQHADRNYAQIEKKGIPLIVMEPVRGGDLANPADEINRIFKEASPSASLASWALRYVGSLPQVRVILSGMSTQEQVKDNLSTFASFKPLTPEEYKVIDRVNEAIERIPKIGCTACKYCMPCPSGVDIPTNFRIYNDYQKFQNAASAKWNFANLEKGIASACIECGACMTKCPQHIEIPEQLKKVNGLANH